MISSIGVTHNHNLYLEYSFCVAFIPGSGDRNDRPDCTYSMVNDSLGGEPVAV